METALPILLFLAGLFGLVLLVLICGMQSRELEHGDGTSRQLSSRDFLGTSRFFADVLEPRTPRAAPAEDLSVRRLEQYLREEAALVDEFVERPSLEQLHGRRTCGLLSGEALHERVERYLRREQERVVAFLSDPSVESLYGLPSAA